jgi:hypothetical protein
VPRREHDVAVSREHERVAELERENEVLRDYIEAQADERQAVIERYERLLEQRDADDGRTDRPSSPSGTSGTTGRLSAVRTALSALRSRVARRVGLD